MNYLDPNDHIVRQMIDTMMSVANEKYVMQLIEILKPTLSQDGNRYCFLYGELPNDCVVGFGETVWKAAADFHTNFYTQKACVPVEVKEVQK